MMADSFDQLRFLGKEAIFMANFLSIFSIQMLYVEPRPTSHQGEDATSDNDDDDLDDKEEDREEKKTLKARLQAIQVFSDIFIRDVLNAKI